MTPKKALELVKKQAGHWNGDFVNHVTGEKFNAFDILEPCAEKATAKKVELIDVDFSNEYGNMYLEKMPHCPSCHTRIYHHDNYCAKCSQKLEYEDTPNDEKKLSYKNTGI